MTQEVQRPTSCPKTRTGWAGTSRERKAQDTGFQEDGGMDLTGDLGCDQVQARRKVLAEV